MSTRFGLHIATGPRNGYGLVAAASPAAVISVGEGGALLEAWEKSNRQTVTIFREQTVFHDAPLGIDHMTTDQARAVADHVWPQLMASYRLNPADFYQPTNETGGDNRKSLANIFAFETRLMELAEAEDEPVHLAVASPAGGSPGDWDIWVDLFVPHIRRAGSGGHIYNRHAYGGVVEGSSGFLTKAGPAPEDANAGRPFREAEFLRQQGIFTPMIITEAGQNAGFRFPGRTPFIEDMARYDQLCQQHSNIWGFCSWTYGKYLDFPANIQPASPRMAQYLHQQGGATRPAYPEPAVVDTGIIIVEPDVHEPVETEEPPLDTGGTDSDAEGPVEDGTPTPPDDPGPVEGEHGARFVAFFTADDLDAVPAGQEITVIWRVRNSGTSTWDHRFGLSQLKQELAAPVHQSLFEASGRHRVEPGEEINLTVTMVAPDEPRELFYESIFQLVDHEGQPFGHRYWIRADVVPGPEVGIPALQAKPLQTGVNINPDDAISNPVDSDILRGLNWVRFPFKAADKRRSVAESFAEYDPIVEGYIQKNIGSLIILNQQTVAGDDAPWRNNGDWSAYADRFAAAAGDIAARYAHLGNKVAYEIWNEGDNPDTPWVSVFVPPGEFAKVLGRSAAAIRQAAPEAKIVFGGLSTGPDRAASYVTSVRRSLGGDLPVDGIGIHPYGRWPLVKPFPDWRFGTLAQVFEAFRLRDVHVPLWITELGIPGHQNVIGPEHYPAITRYFGDLFRHIAEDHAAQVPVVIWFAWSDNMENAGIVKSDGTPKEGLFDSFTAVRDRTLPGL